MTLFWNAAWGADDDDVIRRRNAIARNENATATRASDELVALYNPTTGALVGPFPPTLGQLERMERKSLTRCVLLRDMLC